MRKKLFVFTVVAALLISMLPTNSIFAAWRNRRGYGNRQRANGHLTR